MVSLPVSRRPQLDHAEDHQRAPPRRATQRARDAPEAVGARQRGWAGVVTVGMLRTGRVPHPPPGPSRYPSRGVRRRRQNPSRGLVSLGNGYPVRYCRSAVTNVTITKG